MVPLLITRVLLVLSGNVSIHHWDTRAYVEASHASLGALLADPGRAPAYPLLVRILNQDDRALVVFQSLLASLSWLFLAATLARFFPDGRLRLSAFLAVYLMSLSAPVLQWDYVLYAESASLSCFALAAAFLMRWLLDHRRCDLLALGALLVPFTLLRDSNFTVFAVIAAFVLHGARRATLGEAARRDARWAAAALVLGPVLLTAFSVAPGGRGAVSVENAILRYVAPEPALLEHMVARYDLPRSAARCAGATAWTCADAELEEWLRTRGRAAYARFLLGHPGFVLRILGRQGPSALTMRGLTIYGDLDAVRAEHERQAKVHATTLLPGVGSLHRVGRAVSEACSALNYGQLVAILAPHRTWALVGAPFFVFGVLLAVRRRHLGVPVSLLPAAFFVAAALSQLPIVLLDAAEAPRHALIAAVSTNLLAVALVLVAASVWWRSRNERSPAAPARPEGSGVRARS